MFHNSYHFITLLFFTFIIINIQAIPTKLKEKSTIINNEDDKNDNKIKLDKSNEASITNKEIEIKDNNNLVLDIQKQSAGPVIAKAIFTQNSKDFSNAKPKESIDQRKGRALFKPDSKLETNDLREEKALPFFYDLYTQEDLEPSLDPSEFIPIDPYEIENRSGTKHNSPIYYIRLPPAPYLYMPGIGYVSQRGAVSPIGPARNPIFNVPVSFISNGKPSNVYQPNKFTENNLISSNYPNFDQNGYQQSIYQNQQLYPQNNYNFPPSNIYQTNKFQGLNNKFKPTSNYPNSPINNILQGMGYQKPTSTNYYQNEIDNSLGSTSFQNFHKPIRPEYSNSNLINLQGQYQFNGKPSDNIFVLRDSYNSLYSDALQNFYP